MKTRDCSGRQKYQIEKDGTLTNYIMLAMGKCQWKFYEMLFNHEIRHHIVTETVRYAQVQHNCNSFEMSEHDLKCCVGTLFLSDYHTLPQQDMYWERQNDAGIPLVYEVISKNKFKQMKKYTHLSDNTQLDKVIKVRRLYDTTNRSLQQFGFWHLD